MGTTFARALVAAVAAGAAVLAGAGPASAATGADLAVAESRSFDGRAIGATAGQAIEGALNSAHRRAAVAGFGAAQCRVTTQGALPVGTSGWDGYATVFCQR